MGTTTQREPIQSKQGQTVHWAMVTRKSSGAIVKAVTPCGREWSAAGILPAPLPTAEHCKYCEQAGGRIPVEPAKADTFMDRLTAGIASAGDVLAKRLAQQPGAAGEPLFKLGRTQAVHLRGWIPREHRHDIWIIHTNGRVTCIDRKGTPLYVGTLVHVDDPKAGERQIARCHGYVWSSADDRWFLVMERCTPEPLSERIFHVELQQTGERAFVVPTVLVAPDMAHPVTAEVLDTYLRSQESAWSAALQKHYGFTFTWAEIGGDTVGYFLANPGASIRVASQNPQTGIGSFRTIVQHDGKFYFINSLFLHPNSDELPQVMTGFAPGPSYGPRVQACESPSGLRQWLHHLDKERSAWR